jgi:HlyD family secretion protein
MKRSPRLLLIPLLVIVVAGLWLVLRSTDRSDALEVSGTIEATEAALAFPLAGRIQDVLVMEGDRVVRGEVLATADRAEIEAQMRSAEAQAAAATARLRELQAGFRSEEVAQGEAAVRAAVQRADGASREAARAERLYDGGAISVRQRDQAATALEVARADLDAADERLGLLRAGARTEQIAAQRAAVQHAEALVAQLVAVLDRAVIRAPFDGTVAIRHREPGETIAPGVPVVTLRSLAERWVRVYVPEADFGRLEIGTGAEIRADPFPNQVFRGSVTFMADAAEFTPRTIQTPDERVKLVFRVKVRIAGDSLRLLKPGLPADVRLLLTQS